MRPRSKVATQSAIATVVAGCRWSARVTPETQPNGTSSAIRMASGVPGVGDRKGLPMRKFRGVPSGVRRSGGGGRMPALVPEEQPRLAPIQELEKQRYQLVPVRGKGQEVMLYDIFEGDEMARVAPDRRAVRDVFENAVTPARLNWRPRPELNRSLQICSLSHKPLCHWAKSLHCLWKTLTFSFTSKTEIAETFSILHRLCLRGSLPRSRPASFPGRGETSD